jgi:hypothetical protein
VVCKVVDQEVAMDEEQRIRDRLRTHVEPVAARKAARLEEELTPLLARLLASAGEGGELRLVDGAGHVLGRWQAAEDLARELATLHA